MWTPPINESAELTEGALWLIHYSEASPPAYVAWRAGSTTLYTRVDYIP